MYFEVYQDTRSEWRWRLIAANAQRIADSGEGYTSKASCEHGIALVKSAHSAPVRYR
ncbi:MAG: DUF1508 domain-containing protein [Gemmatimonadales bacterium]|nr:DUF1508 domain-containing protein [Gemmatimonadales bacterium]